MTGMAEDSTFADVRFTHDPWVVAERRGQSLAQLALSWLLRDSTVASTLVGASSVAPLDHRLQRSAPSWPERTNALPGRRKPGGWNLRIARSVANGITRLKKTPASKAARTSLT